jgi:signal transduction histidine kinase
MRARATAVAVTVVAVALALSALILVSLVGRTERETVTTAVATRAQEVAADVAHGALDVELGGSHDGALVQVLAGSTVVAASPALVGHAPLTRLHPAPGEQREAAVDGAVLGEPEDTYELAVVGVPPSTGADRVAVVQSLAVAEKAETLVGRLAAIGGPVLLGVVGLATWLSVGHALRPVEAIRARTARISAQDLSARVPQPQTRDEVSALAATMNAMLARLQSAVARQRAFVSDAGHELRSPIATIRAEIEVAQALGPRRETFTDVLAETDRLERLVTDLLTLASADERQWRIGSPQDVDLDDLVNAERARLHGRPEIRVTADISPARAWGDRSALTRVLRNVVDNAVRHARSRVHLACGSREPLGAWIRVEDDGPGVPAPDQERVFDRFVRLDEARTRSDGGSGLGLAIVRELVSASGGTVRFTDQGRLPGARLLIELPGQPPPGSNR